MIGKIKVDFSDLKYDMDGNAEITFKVDRSHSYLLKNICKSIKQGIAEGKEKLSLSIDWYKNKRTLDQNALMWALLTEYANGMNGGRTGGITPEEIYYRMLSKYGIAEFLLGIEEAEETLLRNFRVVKRIDTRTVNGQELIAFKCYPGSSTYDAKQMGNLIDGILDELVQAEIENAEVRSLREEWQSR